MRNDADPDPKHLSETSVAAPDSIGTLDPKKLKKIKKFHVMKCWVSSLEG